MTPLIGKQAPRFQAKAVQGGKIIENFTLEQYLGKKYVVFFFYPKDFTFVCPTELLAFEAALPQFEERDVALVACSTDGEYSHWAWLQTPQAEGGIQGVSYPLVADTNKTIAADYGVLAGQYEVNSAGQLQAQGELVAYRGLFLIDKQGCIQHQTVNAMPLGRSVKETLRVIDALQHFENNGEVCPMNWQRGEPAMKPNAEGVRSYLQLNQPSH